MIRDTVKPRMVGDKWPKVDMYEGISVTAPTEPVSKLLLCQWVGCQSVKICESIEGLIQSSLVLETKNVVYSQRLHDRL